MQIQLSEEEALSFKGVSDQLDAFVAGAQALANHVKQMHLKEILAQRKPEAPSSSAQPPLASEADPTAPPVPNS